MRNAAKNLSKKRSVTRAMAQERRNAVRQYTSRPKTDGTLPTRKSTSLGKEPQEDGRSRGTSGSAKAQRRRRKVGDYTLLAAKPASKTVGDLIPTPQLGDARLDKLFGVLGDLPRPELERAAQRVGILLAAKTPKARDRKLLECDWHRVAEVLLTPMGVPVLPFIALSKQSFVGSFRRGVIVCEDYVVAMKPKNRAQVMRARLKIAEVLLEWLRSCGVPVSMKAFCQNLMNAATAMERSFPDYRNSGLLHVIIGQL